MFRGRADYRGAASACGIGALALIRTVATAGLTTVAAALEVLSGENHERSFPKVVPAFDDLIIRRGIIVRLIWGAS